MNVFQIDHIEMLQEETDRVINTIRYIPKVFANAICSIVIASLEYLSGIEFDSIPVVTIINYDNSYIMDILDILLEQDYDFGIEIINTEESRKAFLPKSDIVIDLSQDEAEWYAKYTIAKNTAFIIAPFYSEPDTMKVFDAVQHSFYCKCKSFVAPLYKAELMYYAINRLEEEQ